MGIVRRQSMRSSFLTYIGFAIGAINTFFLFPHYFTPDQFGLTRVLLSVGNILVGFAAMGTAPVFTKFYPYYKAKLADRKNDLFFIVLVLCLIGFLLVVAGSWVFKDLIVRKFSGKSRIFIDYFYLIYPFTFFLLLFNLLENYSWNRQESVLPNFLREVFVRLVTSILIIAFMTGLLGFSSFMYFYALLFGFAAIILYCYLRKKNALQFSCQISDITRRLYKRMIAYGGFVFGGSIFLVIAQNIDAILIASIIGSANVAVFEIATYVATLMVVPQRSIAAIATPLIAEGWKNKDLGKIEELYKKSAITQLVAGILIFGLIWLNISPILQFLPPAYHEGKYVILILGIAKLVDLGTGLNYQVLVNSRYWKLDFVSYVILVVFSIGTNYFLIKRMGIIGAAWSNLFAISAFNLLRFLFIKWKFGIQPFTIKTVYCLLIGIVAYYISWWFYQQHGIYVGIFIGSSIFAFIFISMILVLKISDDINIVATTFKKRILSLLVKK